MASMNRVFLAGNLTRDPALKKTASGTAVADLGLAVTETYNNKEGHVVESTCFADVVTWGRLAENCHQHLGKGSPVLVEGRLETDSWETENGQKRSRLRIRADRIQFLGRPRNGAPEEGQPKFKKTEARPVSGSDKGHDGGPAF